MSTLTLLLRDAFPPCPSGSGSEGIFPTATWEPTSGTEYLALPRKTSPKLLRTPGDFLNSVWVFALIKIRGSLSHPNNCIRWWVLGPNMINQAL